MEHKTPDCQCIGKQCRDCLEVKCWGYFPVQNKKRGDLRPKNRCRPCYNQDRYAWGKANPEKVKEITRNSNKKRKKRPPTEHVKQQRIKNAHKWNQAHKEEMREHRNKWNRENPEKVKEINNQWRKDNQERAREYARINTSRRRAYKSTSQTHFTVNEWRDIKAKYQHTCLCCGQKEPNIKLSADHIIPLSKGGSNEIDNIQPLCNLCNSRKGVKTIDFRRQITEFE